MNIKKKIFITSTLIMLIFIVSFTFNKKPHQYTLKESLSIAFTEARKIAPDAELYLMSSLDDLNAKPTNMGADGKRHKWNFDFNVPNTTEHILLTLYSDGFKNIKEISGPNFPENLIKLDEIVYDSPELVKKAKTDFNLSAGKNWAKGFHFVLGKENNIPYVSVVGDNPSGELTFINYNPTTGNLLK